MLITEPTVRENNREKKWIAIIIAAAVHGAMAILFLLVTVVPAIREEPELVARVVEPTPSEDPLEKKNVMEQVRRAAQSSAAAPVSRMLRADSAARLEAPDVERLSSGPIGLGQGDFGEGFGKARGLGSGSSFFGSRSTGRRFLYVLDHSASMSTAQERLRNRELEKALRELPRGVQYQVILFGGGALFAEPGWKAEDFSDRFEVTDPRRRKYIFRPFRGVNDWEFEGRDDQMPRANWLPITSQNIQRTIEALDGVEKFFGTDWGVALKIAHLMRPSPDVIFFMSDGSGGNAPDPILEINRRFGRPKINTFAMQTENGARQFQEIAERTGGKFVIVNREGKPIDGEAYLADPNQYRSLIR